MAGSRLTMEILDIKPGTSTEDLQDDDDDVDGLSLFPVRRRLLSDLRESFSTSPDDRMKVYLRIRPFSSTETESGEQRDCMTVKTEKTVMTSAPHDSHAFKSSANRVAEYTFSHIFDEETSQKQFFNQTMMGLVKDFIDGQNCLVFTYGVTNSGKTYTMQGNPSDAGVLPRSLDVIFNSVQGRQWDKMNLKPSLFTNVKWLSAEEELAEKRAKLKVFKLCSDHDIDVTSLLGEDMSDISTANSTVSSDVSCLSTVSSIHSPRSTGDKGVFEELASRIREEMAVDVEDQGKLRYSIWVSFAEIYNEQIYDLLEPLPKKKDARRVCLKLKEDKNGSPYIHGLKDINVTSADEAYKLLTIGQRNLQTACTKLNHNSSRSHCIFNIKIIRVMDKPDPHVSRVSTLSLCDLAGSERYTKTQTTGERLKEAGSINTSLLTLSRCMEALRQTQKKKDKIVPFRESKLTRLFQNYFVGQGTAAMIVNVSQCASTFDETLQVFRFSAKAKQVITVQKPVFHKPKLPVILHNSPPPIARSSISWATPGPNNAGMRDLPTAANLQLPDEDDDMEEEEEEDSERMYTQADVDELLCVIEKVHTELDRIQKSNEKLEGSIRREVCKEMQQQFVEIERTCSDRIKIYEQITEDKYEKKIQLVMDAERAKRAKLQKMVDKDDEWVSSIVLHAEEVKVERLTDKNKELEEEIELLKSSSTQDNKFAELLKENEALKCKSVKNEISQTDNNEEDAMNYLHHKLETATASIDEQAIEISELNDMLTEAGETFEQKEVELSKLKTLLQEYEEKMETQSEAINVLETAAKDSVVAVETANESLTKRVECVTSLQTEIRELKGKLTKCELVLQEKDEEVTRLKQKNIHDGEEHTASQTALIHGFTAEISTLKTQINHFKLQSLKSPSKCSPGRNMLHTMAQNSPTPRKLDSSFKEVKKTGMNDEIKDLQVEMDKTAAATAELEHALQMSRSATKDLEKKLDLEVQNHQQSKSHVQELERELHKANSMYLLLRQGGDNKMEDNSSKVTSSFHSARISEVSFCFNEKEIEQQTKQEEHKQKVERLERALTDKIVDLARTGEELAEATRDKAKMQRMRSEMEAMLKEKETEVSEILAEKKKLEFILTQDENNLQVPAESLTEKDMNEIKAKLHQARDEKKKADVEMKERLNAAETLSRSLTKDLDNLKQVSSAKDAEISELNGKLQSFSCIESQKSELEARLTKANEALESKEEEVQMFTVNLDAVLEEQEKGGHQPKTRKTRKGSEKSKDKKLQQVSEQEKEQFVTKLHSLEENKASLQAEIQQLQGKQADHQANIDNLKKDCESHKTEMLKLDQERGHCLTEVHGLKEERDKHLAEIRQLTQDRDKKTLILEEVVVTHKSEMETSMFDLDELKATQELGEMKLKQAQTNHTEATERVQELETLLKVAENKLTSVSSKTDDEDSKRKKEVEEIRCQLEVKCKECEEKSALLSEVVQVRGDLEKEILKLQELNSTEENTQTELEDKLNDAQCEIAELKASVCTHKTLHHKFKGEREDAQLDLQSSLNEVSILKQELEKMRTGQQDLEDNRSENLRIVTDMEERMNILLAEKEKEVETLMEKFDSLKSESGQQEAALKENVFTLRDELKIATEKLEESGLARNETEKESKTLKETVEQQVIEHEKRAESYEQKINLLTAENEERLGSAEGQLNSVIKEKETEIENLDCKIKELQCDLKQRQTDWQSETSELKTRLTTEISTVQTKLESSLDQVAKYEKDIKKITEEKSEILKEKDDLELRLITDEEELTDKDELLSRLRKAEDELKTMEELRLQLTKKDKELENKREVEGKVKKLEVELEDRKDIELRLKDTDNTLKEKADLELQLNEMREKLTKKEDDESRLEATEAELIEVKKERSSLESQLAGDLDHLKRKLSEAEKVLKNEENQYQTLRGKYESLQVEHQKLRVKCTSLEKEYENLRTEKVVPSTTNIVTKDLEEVRRLYEAEKLKNEKYKDMINETNQLDCFSPQTNVRRMRKEKIEAENSLIEARYQIKTLEDKTREVTAAEKHRAESYQKTSAETCVPSHDPLLQRKLNKVTGQLHEMEANNRKLIKEVTSLQSQLETLELDKSERSADDSGSTTADDSSRVSIASVRSRRRSMVSDTSHLELKQSLERIEELKEQLLQCSNTILEWSHKFEEESNRKQELNKDLQIANTRIKTLQSQSAEKFSDETEKQMTMARISDLELQMVVKQQELEKKSSALREAQRLVDNQVKKMQQLEKDKANSDEIVTLLKESLGEQETMLQQMDDLTNDKDEEIITLKQDHLNEVERMRAQLSTLQSQQDNSKQHSARETSKVTEGKLNELRQSISKQAAEIESQKKLVAEKEAEMKQWRRDKDKLVSSFEVLLTKKTIEIQQLQEKEHQVLKSVQAEREQIASGLMKLHHQSHPNIKQEQPDLVPSVTEDTDPLGTSDKKTRRTTSSASKRRGRTKTNSCTEQELNKENDTSLMGPPSSADVTTPLRSPSHLLGSTRKSSTRRRRTDNSTSRDRSVRIQEPNDESYTDTPVRGRKRTSLEKMEKLDIQPPLPKRISKGSAVSDSDDISSHFQVDATPPVAAKTLRKTRKKMGSITNLAETEEPTETKPMRRSKRSAKSRILESFRESPIGRSGKRLLDNISEVLSPRSPTKETDQFQRTESTKKSKSRESLYSADSLEHLDRKSGKRRHKLYKEDSAFISEPMECAGQFVEHEDPHKTVTRSLRSRRH